MNTFTKSSNIILMSFIIFFNINITFSQCFSKISVSNTHSLAIKVDGTLWAWGSNFYGELGDGTNIINRSIPTQIGNSSNWLSISAGDGYYSIALKTDGTLWAWGRNNLGQLGDGTISNKNIPSQIGTDNNWSQISTGDSYTIATKLNGSLWTWGSNVYTLGNGLVQSSLVPINVITTSNWRQVTASKNNTLGLVNSNSQSFGLLRTWGNNNNGQLGDGTTANKTTPINVGGLNPSNNWVKFKTSGLHTGAINFSSKLWTWGDNFYGQLGDGTVTDRNSPTQIGTDNWSKIECSSWRTYGIKTNGTLWAWGRNNFSGSDLLGVGNNQNNQYNTPFQIGTDNNWVDISSTGSHTLAIKTDGSLWSWGDNLYGQLGDGTTITKSSPVNITCPTTLSTNLVDYNFNFIKVYPNPTNSIVNIEAHDSQIEKIELYDLTGKLLITEITKSNKYIIDISNVGVGTYLLKIFTEKGVKSTKFLIK